MTDTNKKNENIPFLCNKNGNGYTFAPSTPLSLEKIFRQSTTSNNCNSILPLEEMFKQSILTPQNCSSVIPLEKPTLISQPLFCKEKEEAKVPEECQLTKEQLKAVMPNATDANIDKFLPYINEAMKKYSINTPKRAVHFLAQLAHESGSLRYTEEIASGKAYENRKDLGNTQKGDGIKFKGRGLIQLTGRANYKSYGDYIGLDLTKYPKRVADPDLAVDVAGWFWNKNNLNNLADKDNIEGITKRINGGFNGLNDRKKHLKKAKKAKLCEKEESKGKNGILIQGKSDYHCDESKMTDEERYIYRNRKAIREAARKIDTKSFPIYLKNPKIDADLVGAIMLDELQRRDFGDDIQETEARFIKWYEGGIEKIERKLLSMTFKPIEDISIGPAQMKPSVVEDLVNKGLIKKPSDWDNNKIDISIDWLLSPEKSAELVGARLEQIVTHWAKGSPNNGVDISDKPEILGTLYSIGLTGRGGINPDPKSNERGEKIANELREKARKILSCPDDVPPKKKNGNDTPPPNIPKDAPKILA
jgi:predicted chitinase